MPVFSEFPYLNFHEMNTEWLIKTMKELSDKWENLDIDDLERELKNYIDSQITVLADLRHEHSYNAIEFYVDGVNGSNVNGDGTIAHPYYSIAKALDVMEQTGAGAVINLVSGATYLLPNAIISGCSLDIRALDTGITINWMNSNNNITREIKNAAVSVTGYSDGSTKFYHNGAVDTLVFGSALKVSNCEIMGGLNASISMGNGFADFLDCTIDMPVKNIGGYLHVDNCSFTDVNRNAQAAAVTVDHGILMFEGGVTADNTGLDVSRTNYFIYASKSLLFLSDSTGGLDSANINPLTLGFCWVYMFSNYAAWTTHSVYGASFINGGRYYSGVGTLTNMGPQLIQQAASYGTAYNVGGYDHVGIKATFTHNGQSGTSFVDCWRTVNGNWHLTIGFADNMLYRLNCQFVGTNNFRVVSCTAYELDGGSYTTTQNADVTFDIYVIP